MPEEAKGMQRVCVKSVTETPVVSAHGSMLQPGTTVGMSTSCTYLAALDAVGQGTVTESATKQASCALKFCLFSSVLSSE